MPARIAAAGRDDEGELMRTMSLVMMLAAVLMMTAGVGTGCHKKGPGEKAGEKMDDAAQKVKDKIDPPGPAEKAGRKVDDALGKD
jgi:hypothetical protein